METTEEHKRMMNKFVLSSSLMLVAHIFSISYFQNA